MNIFEKNKKGFYLAEETLKMVVGVICVLFLITALVLIYYSSTSAKKLTEAKDSIARIETIVTSLVDGGETQSQDISNPKGWHIYTFTGESKPNSCLSENCLCICDNPLIEQIKSKAKKCDEKGTCITIPTLSTSDLDLKITGTDKLLFVGFKKLEGQIFIGELK